MLNLPSDVIQWFYYPIPMPLNHESNGPVSIEEASNITYEVWDKLYESHASFDHLPDAINEAIRLNLENCEWQQGFFVPKGFFNEQT